MIQRLGQEQCHNGQSGRVQRQVDQMADKPLAAVCLHFSQLIGRCLRSVVNDGISVFHAHLALPGARSLGLDHSTRAANTLPLAPRGVTWPLAMYSASVTQDSLGVDGRRPEVPQHHATFRDDRPLARADDAEPLWIDLRQEDRRPVARNVVVVSPAPGISQEQAVLVRQPVLLRVVAAQFAPIVERPRLDWLVVQAVVADGHIALDVVADRQVEAIPEGDDRRLAQAAHDVQRQFVPMLQVGQLLAVERAVKDGDARRHVGRLGKVDRHQQGAVRQDEPLGTGVAGHVELVLTGQLQDLPFRPCGRSSGHRRHRPSG